MGWLSKIAKGAVLGPMGASLSFAKDALGGGDSKKNSSNPDRDPWNVDQLRYLQDEAIDTYKDSNSNPYPGSKVAPLDRRVADPAQYLADYYKSSPARNAMLASGQGVNSAQQIAQAGGSYGNEINQGGQRLGEYVDLMMRRGMNPNSTATGNIAQGTDPTAAIQQNLSGDTNPYLSKMMQQTADTLTSNFNNTVMPRIDSEAVATGGYGGSRQGVAQALAVKDLNRQINDTNSQLAFQTNEAAKQRQLQASQLSGDLAKSADQLNLAQQELGLKGADTAKSMFTDSTDLTSKLPLLAQMYSTLGADQANQSLAGANIFQNYSQQQLDDLVSAYYEKQNAPWSQVQKLGSTLLPAGGLSTSAYVTPPEPSSFSKILGGGMTGLGAAGMAGAAGLGPMGLPIGVGAGLLSMLA